MIFAVQSDDECFTHPEAEQTYDKYGRQTGCKHGQGGLMRNDVYKLLEPATYKCYWWTSDDLTTMRKNGINEASYCADFLGYMNNPGKSSIISSSCLGCSCCIRSFNRRKVPPTPSTVPPPTTSPKSTHTPIQGNGSTQTSTTTTPPPQPSRRVRFVNPQEGSSDGTPYIGGYVQVWYRGRWGTICDDGMTTGDRGKNLARVLCSMAGYRNGDYSRSYSPNTEDLGEHMWLDEVNCGTWETDINQCKHGGWSRHDCTQRESVAIKCYTDEVTKASEVSSFNLNACIGGVIGAIALIMLVYGFIRYCKSKRSEDPRTVKMTTVNGNEDQSPNNELPTTTPKDSTLTEISDGPPRYKALFPPGYVPVKSEEGSTQHPSYDVSLRTSTENL